MLKFPRGIGFRQFLAGHGLASTTTATDAQDPFRREISDDNPSFEKSLEVLGQIKQPTGCLVIFQAPTSKTLRWRQTVWHRPRHTLQRHLEAGDSRPPRSLQTSELSLAPEGFFDDIRSRLACRFFFLGGGIAKRRQGRTRRFTRIRGGGGRNIHSFQVVLYEVFYQDLRFFHVQ